MADEKKEANSAQALLGCLVLMIFALAVFGLGMSIVWRITHW